MFKKDLAADAALGDLLRTFTIGYRPDAEALLVEDDTGKLSIIPDGHPAPVGCDILINRRALAVLARYRRVTTKSLDEPKARLAFASIVRAQGSQL